MFLKKIFAREANIRFKNIKFPRGNFQPIAPRQKHCVEELSADSCPAEIGNDRARVAL